MGAVALAVAAADVLPKERRPAPWIYNGAAFLNNLIEKISRGMRMALVSPMAPCWTLRTRCGHDKLACGVLGYGAHVYRVAYDCVVKAWMAVCGRRANCRKPRRL
eukprot:CAMPEP_0183349662 /NCGR_PEP_ID=MMETSP0164_2-20130417/13774_1 /TAXON_ID=221442 /ORGANISM="Coccolithus pelagicus ssp braarudi, Strain PLY182g" /LENGTH=104 /DNA_ID=CAMNT_0025521419 /DNA_START=173 /DNA_END=484 /DNA_ORIENTATION=-